jgi:hypothetical protein
VLHPVKTKIVYCKDANRRGDFPIISFDFLGFQFRARKTIWNGSDWTGSDPGRRHHELRHDRATADALPAKIMRKITRRDNPRPAKRDPTCIDQRRNRFQDPELPD